MTITPFELAQRYVGIKEIAGAKNHPLVQWWLSLCTGFSIETPDEVAWCSAFVNGIAWELRLARSKSAAARSWLMVGLPIKFEEARPDSDVVILKRGTGSQPSADVISAPGHVGFFAGVDVNNVLLLGGNQANGVCIERFNQDRILGVRRLA